MKKNIQWLKTVKREYRPLFNSLFMKGYGSRKLWKEYLGIDYSMDNLMIIESVWFYESYHMNEFANQLADMVLKDKNLFTKLVTISLKYEKNLVDSTKNFFNEFIDAYIKFSPTVAMFFICDNILENEIMKRLEEKIGHKRASELMILITKPEMDNFHVMERLSILKNDINSHMKEFSWFASRYGNRKDYSKTHVLTLKEELTNQDYIKKYQSEKADIKNAVLEAKKALGKENEHFIDVMQFFIYYRTHRTDIINMSIYMAHHLISDEARKFGVGYEELTYCTLDEIKNKKMPSIGEIERRKIAFSIVSINNDQKIFTGKESLDLKNKYFVEVDDAVEVHGRVAYPGKITGKAIVINSEKDLSRISLGDILITTMTTPNMIQQMLLAKAFITDEGGITCHAAIISREMKKPCLIGTGKATRVFKDGDIIELNTDLGKARKVN